SFLGSMLASTRIVYLVAAAIFSPFGLPALLNFLAGKLALASKSAKGNLGGKAGVPDLEAVPSDYEAIVKEGVENESYWDNKV
ncbi:MAG: hypothetical protein LBC41_00845, partial [Clostridiales bacterium]|nr:hypothetical protein [Clostridiales bacterium]